jgi:methylmalonyl-CoA mutase cobalamin-binding subunit
MELVAENELLRSIQQSPREIVQQNPQKDNSFAGISSFDTSMGNLVEGVIKT